MATIESVSTQKNKDGRPAEYRFRDTEDIAVFTRYVMKGNRQGRPVHSSSRGFLSSKDDPKAIADEMEQVQILHKKTNGLRIRGEILNVDKSELGKDSMEGIKHVADAFSDYYMGRGHQVAYGIYDTGGSYEIRYAINTTNYADGSKYKHNNYDIQDQEERCLASIIAEVNGKCVDCETYDFDELEYHM